MQLMKSMHYNLKLLRRPLPFQLGTLTLWSDDYIADNVLKKHLDETIDSGSRKRVTMDASILWITEHCAADADILDIGCGPGLYGNRLGTMIRTYVGLDISPYQIAYAKSHNTSSHNTCYQVCDFRKWRLQSQQKYDMVLLLYAIYSFYPIEDRVGLLRKVKGMLKPDGCVILELFTANHYEGRENCTDWEYIEKNGFWKPSPYLELNAFTRYRNDLVLIQAGVVDDTIEIWNSWIELFSISKIERELQLAGFSKFSYYGSCTGEKYMSTSDVLCVIAKL